MDAAVLQAQQWVNATYKNVSGYNVCAEDGITGWATMYCLTRGLQHELGITALSDSFGPTTMSLLTSYGPISKSSSNVNMRTIVEAALYCKGYSGGGIDGGFGSSTQSGLISWKTDMGFTALDTDNWVSAKEMKTLLTMDAYVKLPGGDDTVRAIQRWMNPTFINRKDYQIVPCDGFFSRNVETGLMLAIQYSLGLADGVANGVFGPTTQADLRAQGNLSPGSTDSGGVWLVTLFKAALIFNRQANVDWGTGTFTAQTSSATWGFQEFCKLTVTGQADYETWASLLVSTGDPNRAGTACDCATLLNSARAQAIKAAGYETVGRYIGTNAAKDLTAAEIQIILANGLTFFPIYQEYNNALSYFDAVQGATQAQAAYAAAQNLGLPQNTIIYFAVDFDATADEIRSNVLPFFSGIDAVFHSNGYGYLVGVYGSRNVCSMVSATNYVVTSFVSGMSTGFSGNLGFPLPTNWAFDQIKTLTLASGAAGQIEIDNDIKSGRDPGISSLSTASDPNAAFFAWVRWIESQAIAFAGNQAGTYNIQALTAQYLRTYLKDGAYTSPQFTVVSGAIIQDFLDFCQPSLDSPNPAPLRCPKVGMFTDVEHFGASLGAVFTWDPISDRSKVNVADFGGWVGDLITADSDCFDAGTADSGAHDYGMNSIANRAGTGSFGGSDMVADIDAVVIGMAVRNNTSLMISDALAARYASAAAATAKYQEFVTVRFGDADTMRAAAISVIRQDTDADYVELRATLWAVKNSTAFGYERQHHADLFDGMANAFADVVLDYFVG
ncbi:MAG: glycoside hydrolase domain-containing protein [Frankia sp.]